MRRIKWVMVFFFGWLSAVQALPVEQPLADSAQEARAKQLFHEIRCVVCQGESIADSPAEIAGDMRRDIRERIKAGDSDAALKQSLRARYGDVVLMQPPFNQATLLLWLAPFLILIGALWMARSCFKKRA